MSRLIKKYQANQSKIVKSLESNKKWKKQLRVVTKGPVDKKNEVEEETYQSGAF